ncbi:MAG: Na(+)/H(+) antiporter subunit D [Pseudomonadales bacterium]|nr:Na(+)/H(+) antiporter subunit D [Pseudomonadales bacterium]
MESAFLVSILEWAAQFQPFALIPPAIMYFLAALTVLWSSHRVGRVVMFAMPFLTVFQLVVMVAVQPNVTLALLDMSLVILRVDALSLLFALLFNIAALIGVIYAMHVRDRLQSVSAMCYVGSALGAVFAGDLLTLFIFWELLALSSVGFIWARRKPESMGAGMRYLLVQVVSGLLLLAGALYLYGQTGSLLFNHIGLDGPAGWLILIAFGIKCGFPLLHGWITEAYPAATEAGAVFMAAITTKVAVYALARGFQGEELLVYIGVTMTCFPIFYAVIENDLRRVLAYSMINQLGFMVCGIGVGTTLAVNGAVAHAFNDVIFKGLLFMSMGAGLMQTGRINGSELGGLYRTMPKTTVLCIVGAMSISAFPLLSGFVSKAMIVTAVLEEHYEWVWLALLFASAGVFHHAGIKIPYFAFFAHDSGLRPSEPPTNVLIAMSIAAVLCIGIGIYPTLLYQMLPFDMEYTPYDATHVLAQLQLLWFSALAFVWLNLRGWYPPELPSVNLDVDWIYRKVVPRSTAALLPHLSKIGERSALYIGDGFHRIGVLVARGLVTMVGQTTSIRLMAIYLLTVLMLYLLLDALIVLLH